MLANLLPVEREIGKYLKWERFFHPDSLPQPRPIEPRVRTVHRTLRTQFIGGEVHFRESLNPAEIVRTTRKNRISVIVLVPAQCSMHCASGSNATTN